MRQRVGGSTRRLGVVGLLDVGTSKVVCLIAAPQTRPGDASPAGLRVYGVGHQRSRGLKAGVITDMEAAEQAVRETISQAERMAGVELDDVFVAVSCGRLRSQNFAANADIEAGAVTESDIARLLAGGRAYAEREGRTLIHLNRYGFRIDGATGVRDPRGMAARKLSVDLHAVTADDAPLRNLMLVVERCYLNVAGVIATPYASAIAATSDDERRLGVTCIDIGAGATTLAVFAEGQFLFTDAIPVGGNHITFDIARNLQTPLAEAERIKALYGTLVGAPSDEHETFSYPLAGEEEGEQMHTTKARLTEIIRPRMASLIGLIEERLERGKVRHLAGERVVLTGGASQLVGIGEFTANAMGRPVRLARPRPVPGLPQSIASAAFSTVAGQLVALDGGGAGMMMAESASPSPVGYFGRVGQWLREGF